MESSRTNNCLSHRAAAYKAVFEGTPQSLETFRNFWGKEGVKPLNKCGDTVLHFLAIYGNLPAFSLLLQDGLVTDENLKIKNVNGDTALHEAARFGQKEVAEMILRREKDLGFERNNLGETPLYVAAASGKKEVFEFLRKYGSDGMMRRNDGCTILHAAVIRESYSLAINILEWHPDLAGKRNEKGMTALNLLATKPYSFRSASAYMFKDLGRKPFIAFQIIGAIIYSCIPSLYKESQPVDSAEDPNNLLPIYEVKRSRFTNFILSNPWFKEIDDTKQRHMVALMLAQRLIRREDCNYYLHSENEDFEGGQFGRVPDPLIQATRLGISEVVLEILRVYPEAAYTFDEKGRNILQIVAEEKHRFLYDYLMNIGIQKDRMLSNIDCEGNNIIHLAAGLGSPSSTPPGVMYQMMWDVLWFKRVQYDSYPYLWHLQNSSGKTAAQEFEANHENIRKEAEKKTKEMANYMLIVAALIGTINFAAVFTVPGGFHQKTGVPLFLLEEERKFTLLMWYLAVALFFSLLTMGTLMRIIFLRFHTEDFYVSLPLKYATTTVSMVYSGGFTILACCQAYVVETMVVRNIFPVVVLIISFVLLTLVLLDISFLVFDYLYYVIRYSRSYRGQKA